MRAGSNVSVPEFTLKAVLCGLVFGIVFGAANAFIGLKAGLTVSTSIPIAVLSVALFRSLGRGGTILEANMAQTVGSASSSLASGTIFTIPALFMWGVTPSVTQVAILALCGGLLGILAMVPLRRLLIVQAAVELPYPEGRACADVLHATERGGSGARWIFLGLALGAGVELVLAQFHLLPKEVTWKLGQNASLALRISPALLAVGFIIGFRAAAVMVVGGFLTSLVLYPLVTKAWASGAAAALSLDEVQQSLQAYLDRVPEVPALGVSAAKSAFLLYIGAGAVAAAGLLTVLRTGPTMARSLGAVLAGMRGDKGGVERERTDRDLPGWILIVGILAVVLLLAFVPGVLAGDLSLPRRLLAAVGAAFFAFLFVPVSSRMVGVIGVSSNPTSAMALVTLAGTAAIFALLGWKELDARAAVLTVGTIVCVAASKAGDISQDLKTGQLVGATPALQQYGQLIAATVACWAVAGTVVVMGLGEGFGEGGIPAPQARLMKTIIEAVLGEELPWDLMAMGGAMSLCAALVGLPALSFALGIYLPLATLATIFVGGLVRRYAERGESAGGQSSALQSGILCASGFVAGEGLANVYVFAHAWYTKAGRYTAPEPSALEATLALATLLAVVVVLYRSARKT
ncbi:MAG: oligopeptide transporter, OPT family [Planctomycetes bacterium]|nr:oligopeptide transporter, OPT family [Planctomycetota bacterium]